MSWDVRSGQERRLRARHRFGRGVKGDGGTLVAKPQMWGEDAQGWAVHREGDEERAPP
jgi:hypothetical protein